MPRLTKAEKRLRLFHALNKVSFLKEDELFFVARTRLEVELALNVRRQFINGIHGREAICTAAARYFGVTPRSMQRMWSNFYGPQRRATQRRKG